MRHFPEYAAALLVVLLLLAFAKWAWWPSRRLAHHRIRHLRIRLHLRLHPGRGHATVLELWVRWGRWAAFRTSKRTRKSLGWWARVRAGAWAWSIMLGRAHHRHGLRIGLEEHVLVLSPPRMGKSWWLGQVILRYPGPVLSTTTKHDLFELTAGARRQVGRVHVFNPQNIGNVASTFAWNPVAGCREPAVAIRRADAFTSAVSQKGVEEGAYWSAKASGCLRALFAAGDLVNGDMRLVSRWILTGRAAEAEAILTASGALYTEWAGALAELRSKAQKTAATIEMTLSRAVEFMADPALAAATLPGPGGGFDIESFVASRDALYMIAESRGAESPVAPLFACFADEVHRTAAVLGSQSPSGRMDPPMLMALDEVSQICPVPLPSWLADSGGKGIQLIVVAHGEAQLRERWGENGAQIIMDTTGTKVFLPGITNPATLEMASKLCGQASFREPGQRRGNGDPVKYSRHDVMTPDMVRQLPLRFALILRGGLAPVVTRLRAVSNDRLYRQTRQRGGAIVRPAIPEEWTIPAAPPARPAAPAAPVPAEPAAEPVPVSWADRANVGDPEPWLAPRTAPTGAPARVPDIDPAQFPWTSPRRSQ
jgi:type IV secretory pathway TraG/TraD family ATPase VirD4